MGYLQLSNVECTCVRYHSNYKYIQSSEVIQEGLRLLCPENQSLVLRQRANVVVLSTQSARPPLPPVRQMLSRCHGLRNVHIHDCIELANIALSSKRWMWNTEYIVSFSLSLTTVHEHGSQLCSSDKNRTSLLNRNLEIRCSTLRYCATVKMRFSCRQAYQKLYTGQRYKIHVHQHMFAVYCRSLGLDETNFQPATVRISVTHAGPVQKT